MRLNIAIGAARGLSYLHHDCIPHIIHRDIKTSNILLDADMEARVSDFGLAKLITPQQTHVTTMVAGTLGYLPPGESRKQFTAVYVHMPLVNELFSELDHSPPFTLYESVSTATARFHLFGFELTLMPTP